MEAKLVLEMLEILDVIHRQFQGIIKKNEVCQRLIRVLWFRDA